MYKQNYFGRDFSCAQVVEVLDPTDFVQRGQAQSVYDLYRKMVLGSVDAADYVRPVDFDEHPDLDNPDLTNTVGLELEQVHIQQEQAARVAREQIEEARKRKEAEKKQLTTADKSAEDQPETT